jgi:tryptophan synthase alpha chain
MSPTLAEEGLTIPDAPTEPGEFERSLRATRESGRKLLIAYVTGGLHDEWPDVVRAVADAGADAIEIGIPFSDPVMDGPIIQEASELALRDGASPVTVLDTLRTIDAGVPLAVMTYYNLAFHMGHERFASLMYEAGARGDPSRPSARRGGPVGNGGRSSRY